MIRSFGFSLTVAAATLLVDPAVALTPHPDRAARDVRSDYNASCYQKKADPVRASHCQYGRRGAPIRIAVVGDSTIKQYVSAFHYAGRTRGWEIDVYTRTGCVLGRYPAKRDTACASWNSRVLNAVRARDYDFVVTGLYSMTVPKSSRYDTFGKRHNRFISGVRAQLRAYQANNGPRINLFNAGPLMSRDVPSCIQRNRSRPSTCHTSRSAALDPTRVWSTSSRKKLMRGVVSPRRLISLVGNICTSRTCRAVVGGKIVFRDRHHLTDTYVRNRQGFIARKLDGMI